MRTAYIPLPPTIEEHVKKQNAESNPVWAVQGDGPGVMIIGYTKRGIYDITETSYRAEHIIRLQSLNPGMELVACLMCDHREKGRYRARLDRRYRKKRNAEGWIVLSHEELTQLCRDIREIQASLDSAVSQAAREHKKP